MVNVLARLRPIEEETQASPFLFPAEGDIFVPSGGGAERGGEIGPNFGVSRESLL